LIEGGILRFIVKEMYNNGAERGGRPNIDEISRVKL